MVTEIIRPSNFGSGARTRNETSRFKGASAPRARRSRWQAVTESNRTFQLWRLIAPASNDLLLDFAWQRSTDSNRHRASGGTAFRTACCTRSSDLCVGLLQELAEGTRVELASGLPAATAFETACGPSALPSVEWRRAVRTMHTRCDRAARLAGGSGTLAGSLSMIWCAPLESNQRWGLRHAGLKARSLRPLG